MSQTIIVFVIQPSVKYPPIAYLNIEITEKLFPPPEMSGKNPSINNITLFIDAMRFFFILYVY